MSFGKMNQIIQIAETHSVKDADGFVTKEESILKTLKAYKETKNATEKWVSMATFSSATCLFHFRYLPDLEVTPDLFIISDNERYQILSVENIRNRKMHLEVFAEKVEGSTDG